mmetsp:Transcript_17957/g.61213  ORF Transcript_17957/g.61213 Transcript_17957/m.61213 type:complete len:527 (-) Transcript_17957:503-2083(-)
MRNLQRTERMTWNCAIQDNTYLRNLLKETFIFWGLRRFFRKELRSKENNFQSEVYCTLRHTGHSAQLRTIVFSLKEGDFQLSRVSIETPTTKDSNFEFDQVDAIRVAQARWIGTGQCKPSISRGCSKDSCSDILCERTSKSSAHECTAEIQAHMRKGSNIRPTPAEQVRGAVRDTRLHWGEIAVLMKTLTCEYARGQLSRICSPYSRQVGIDDILHHWFIQEQRNLAKVILNNASPMLSRDLLRCGVPNSYRAKLWSTALGVMVGRQDATYFNKLCRPHNFVQSRLEREDKCLQDCLDDSMQQILRLPEYFVFQETLASIGVAWCCECMYGGYKGKAKYQAIKQDMFLEVQSALLSEHKAHLWLLFAAPICYLYDSPSECYFIFRAIYSRHLFQLHSFTQPESSSFAVFRILKAFEDMLQQYEPKLMFHFILNLLSPLDIARVWISHAFVGHLGVGQVHLLWDRIIAFDSLFPLAILSAAIFSFRKDALLDAKTQGQAERILQDISEVQIVPVLQGLSINGCRQAW